MAGQLVVLIDHNQGGEPAHIVGGLDEAKAYIRDYLTDRARHPVRGQQAPG